MARYIHPNAIISAYLFRASALLYIIYYYLYSDRYLIEAMTTVLSVAVTIGVAWVLTKGYLWIRWVLLVLFILVLPFNIIAIPAVFRKNVTMECLNLLQGVIQGTATILLFRPYKTLSTEPELDEEYHDSDERA